MWAAPADLLSYHQRPVAWYSDEVVTDAPDEIGLRRSELRNWQINQPLFESTTRWPHQMRGEERQTVEAYRPLPALCRRLGYTEPFGGRWVRDPEPVTLSEAKAASSPGLYEPSNLASFHEDDWLHPSPVTEVYEGVGRIGVIRHEPAVMRQMTRSLLELEEHL